MSPAWQDDVLFIANASTGTVSTWDPTSSGTTATTVITGLSNPQSLESHGGLLYIAEFIGGTVRTWDGVTLVTAITALSFPISLAWL